MSAVTNVAIEAYDGWANFMAGNGFTAEEVRDHFRNWSAEDYYPPLATEMRLLADAGFAEPDCFWRVAPFTVFGGVA